MEVHLEKVSKLGKFFRVKLLLGDFGKRKPGLFLSPFCHTGAGSLIEAGW